MLQKAKIEAFDFVRAISVLMIIIFHFISMIIRNGGGNWGEFNLIAPFGSIGVSFFIIISGAGLFISSKKWTGCKEFYIKRFKSIYPTFWFVYIFMSCFLLVFAGRVYVGGDYFKWAITIIGFDGYMSWYMPTYYIIGEWFVGFIVLIYLVFPLIRMSMNASKSFTFITSIICAILTFNFNKEISDAFPLFNSNAVWNPIIRLPEFIFGGIVADLIINDKGKLKYLFVFAVIYLSFSILTYDNLDKGVYSIPSLCALFIVVISVYDFIGKRVTGDFYNVILFFSGNSFVAFLIHHKIIGVLSMYVKINYSDIIAVYIYMMSLLFVVFSISYFLSKPLKYINKIFN
ncbi:acyltransferase family protein [Enterobacter sichuanensis]|uniref:acyltransferase family protein n=1 Tax=Enterobacter sichuanensis TaxID=2071710 RepID=UPI0036D42ADA